MTGNKKMPRGKRSSVAHSVNGRFRSLIVILMVTVLSLEAISNDTVSKVLLVAKVGSDLEKWECKLYKTDYQF